MKKEITLGEAIEAFAPVINKLAEQHLTLEPKDEPLTMKMRAAILFDTLPDSFGLEDVRILACTAIAMLVEERGKNAKLP